MSHPVVEKNPTVSQSMIPLERYGKPEDMGGLVLFLVSKAGAYINGGVHVSTLR